MAAILLVDDSDAFRGSLAEFLREYFPHLLIGEAADADAALETISALRPELILMDVRLGKANGFELTRAVKNLYSPVVCILTSHNLPEYRDAAGHFGADYFLVKDAISMEQMAALIHAIFPSPATPPPV